MTFQMEDLKEFCKKTSLHGWRHLAMEDDSHQGSCQTIGETITNITLMSIYIYISFIPCILCALLPMPSNPGFRLVYWSVSLMLAFVVSAFVLFSSTADFHEVVIVISMHNNLNP